MNLREALEGVVLKNHLPRGTRRLELRASVESEEDLDHVDREERLARERAQKRQYYLKHKAEIIAKQKARRRADPEKARAARKKWRTENPDKVRVIARRLARAAYAKNPEKKRAHARVMHLKHRERRLAYMREYQLKNRDEITARRRAVREAKRINNAKGIE